MWVLWGHGQSETLAHLGQKKQGEVCVGREGEMILLRLREDPRALSFMPVSGGATPDVGWCVQTF